MNMTTPIPEDVCFDFPSHPDEVERAEQEESVPRANEFFEERHTGN